MGQVVEDYADYFIVTQDNPRTESPDQIIKDIKQGLVNSHNYLVIDDREKAIISIIDKLYAIKTRQGRLR